jgi:hypothetical protein
MSNSNPFNTKEFKDLKSKWYKRLKDAGFDDIERQDLEGENGSILKTAAMENIKRSYTVDQFKIKEEYYRLAGQFLNSNKFRSEIDRQIWAMHCEGISIRNIIKALKEKKLTAYRDLVHGAIKKLVKEMKEANVEE